MLVFSCLTVIGQEIETDVSKDSLKLDTLATQATIPADSTLADSLINTITAAKNPARSSDIETTINYDASDSLFFDIDSKQLYLYGDTHIDYDRITLEAERTSVNWQNRTITAQYVTDSTGKKIGKPVFEDGPDSYVTDDIIYNFQTKRARIKGVITEQDGGFMHGEDVKKNEEDELFIRRARYTTCNLEDPHFFIESSKLKVIPGNKVVSGPFNLKFRDLPTPLAFPFGMFPQPKKQASGIIVPTYGEERNRGFFLRDGGYYFAINEYVDLRLTGDIYSKGAYGFNGLSNYYKRYSFRGSLSGSYIANVFDNPQDPTGEPNTSNDVSIRWTHTPETRGNSSFSASVSIVSSSFTQNNNIVGQDFERSISSNFTSNIGYRKTFQGTPFNMSANLRHNQNIQTGIVNLTLPDFTLNTNRVFPFKKIAGSPNSPLAKLSFSHNMAAKNEISNAPVTNRFRFNVANENENNADTLTFTADNLPEIFARGRLGARHNIPISTSMNVLKYFTLSPSFNYSELWYPKELRYTYLEDENAVRIDTVNQFSRAGSWRSGASLNTRIYGTKFFKRGKIKAIRHVMTPSVSFSYNPDFTDEKYGVFSEIQIDSLGNTQRVSKYESFAYGSPGGSESKTIGFSLTNNIEMKVASKKDTITGTKKIKLFDNLGISSGYNIAADSFKLSNININARTSLFNNILSVNFTGTVDPYQYELISESFNTRGERVVVDRRLDRYAWNNGLGLGQLSRAAVNLGLNLSPDKLKGLNPRQSNSNQPLGGMAAPENNVNFEGYTDEEREQIAYIQSNPNEYVDFNVPWSLSAQYNISRTRTGFDEADINQTLRFNGTLGLTDKTQISYNSGFDLERKEFTLTRLSVSRDLHCWTMNFDWVPFGPQQSYFLSIRVKSALLQDLKVEKRQAQNFFN